MVNARSAQRSVVRPYRSPRPPGRLHGPTEHTFDGSVRSVTHRLVVRHRLPGLDRSELDDYLIHRLRLAGCELPVFEPPPSRRCSRPRAGCPGSSTASPTTRCPPLHSTTPEPSTPSTSSTPSRNCAYEPPLPPRAQRAQRPGRRSHRRTQVRDCYNLVPKMQYSLRAGYVPGSLFNPSVPPPSV